MALAHAAYPSAGLEKARAGPQDEQLLCGTPAICNVTRFPVNCTAHQKMGRRAQEGKLRQKQLRGGRL